MGKPSSIDFEATSASSLTLRVEDIGGLADTASVNVVLNDVVEPLGQRSEGGAA